MRRLGRVGSRVRLHQADVYAVGVHGPEQHVFQAVEAEDPVLAEMGVSVYHGHGLSSLVSYGWAILSNEVRGVNETRVGVGVAPVR